MQSKHFQEDVQLDNTVPSNIEERVYEKEQNSECNWHILILPNWNGKKMTPEESNHVHCRRNVKVLMKLWLGMMMEECEHTLGGKRAFKSLHYFFPNMSCFIIMIVLLTVYVMASE